MTIQAVLNRELRDRLKSLPSYQRREPIHLRIVSQHIGDFLLNNTSVFKMLRMLRTRKNASIVLLLDRKIYNEKTDEYIKEEIEKLEELGLRFHKIRNLHAKIITVENNKEKCLLITSANFTHTGYHISHEVGIYLQNHDDETFNRFKRYITHLIMSQNR